MDDVGMDDTELFQQPLRLHLMGLLYVRGEVGFAAVQRTLGATVGNLESHARRLEIAGCLELRRALAPTGFEKRIRITPAGRRRFDLYLDALRSFVDGVRPPPDGSPLPGKPMKP